MSPRVNLKLTDGGNAFIDLEIDQIQSATDGHFSGSPVVIRTVSGNQYHLDSTDAATVASLKAWAARFGGAGDAFNANLPPKRKAAEPADAGRVRLKLAIAGEAYVEFDGRFILPLSVSMRATTATVTIPSVWREGVRERLPSASFVVDLLHAPTAAALKSWERGHSLVTPHPAFAYYDAVGVAALTPEEAGRDDRRSYPRRGPLSP